MQRNKKIISLIYLIGALIVGLLMREMLETVWVVARWPMPDSWVLMPYDIIGIIFGLSTYVILRKIRRVMDFTNDVIVELGKVVWPTQKESMLSTVVVSVLITICAIILGVFDIFWAAMVRLFYQ